MNSIKSKVTDFLKKYQMDYEDFSIEKYSSIFVNEMEKGLNDQKSSLQMIPTYIEVNDEIPVNKKVIVIDAGGTNFRTAVVYFDNNKNPVINDYKQYTMPGSEKQVDKKTFFNTIAEYLKDIIDKSEKIGFCFSYPAEILSNKDGKVLHLSKEIKAKDIEGELIGENINNSINALGIKNEKKFIILNDTVTTLLAGKSAFKDKTYDSFIGFILGTGTNTCYIENNKNIKKITNSIKSEMQIINIESGGFNKGPTGIIDNKYDETTIDPGLYTFEKMISGKYFGDLCCFVIKEAVQEHLFSDNFSKKITTIKELSTAEINNFILYPFSNNNLLSKLLSQGDNNDRIALYYLIDRLIERVAKLTVINLASVVLKTEKGKDPCRPICITAEGTTFYKLKSLKSKIEYYMKDYLINKKERYVEFVNIENATLIGAAIAGLTN